MRSTSLPLSPSLSSAPPAQAASSTLATLQALDADAAATFRSALARVEAAELRAQIQDMVVDHERHVAELSPHLGQGDKASTPPSSSDQRLLLAGKVMVAQVVGDKAVLGALQEVTEACNAAYEQALGDVALAPQALAVIERNFGDERRHRHWFQRALARPSGGDWHTDAFAEMEHLLEAGGSTQAGDFRAPPY